MTAQELLSQLRAKGVEIKTSGQDRLVIDAPKGTINEELRAALSAHKADLLAILKHEQATAQKAPAANERIAPPVIAVQPTLAGQPAPAPAMTKPLTSEDIEIAASTAEEIAQLETELMRLRTEEEGR